MVNHKLARWAQRSLSISAVLFLGTVALVFLAGLFLPDHFEVQRTLTIDATRERIHPHLIDLANWREWTPWEKTDATLVHEYSDPSSGVGAWHLWRGEDVGAGRIEITAADVERGVWYDMSFDLDPDPMRGALRYLPSDTGVLLEWSLRGELNGPLERAIGPILTWRADAEFEECLAALARLIADSG
jgi:hypothetical protein